MGPIAIVLSTSREVDSARQAREQAIVDILARRAAPPLLIVPHVYDLASEGPVVEALRSVSAHLIVLGWMAPRAMYWTLVQFGIDAEQGLLAEPLQSSFSLPDRRTIWCVDLSEESDVASCVGRLEPIWARNVAQPPPTAQDATGQPRAAAAQTPVPPRRLNELVRPRWYPVIDGRRCRHCLECLNFCLFGVYSLDRSGAVRVERPDACRPGCPACARMCPAGAIMFPGHAEPDSPQDTPSPLDRDADNDLDDLIDDVDNLSL